MATSQRPRAARPSAPQSDPATRGLVLVVVAVVIGLALLFKGTGGGSEDSAAESTDTSVAPVPAPGPDVTSPTSMKAPTTSVAPATLVASAVNSTGAAGVAKKAQTRLAALGYTATKAANGSTKAATSAVYAQPGFEADGAAVAAALGLPTAEVKPLPADMASMVKDPTPGTQVLVILGADALNLPSITGKADGASGAAGASGASGAAGASGATGATGASGKAAGKTTGGATTTTVA